MNGEEDRNHTIGSRNIADIPGFIVVGPGITRGSKERHASLALTVDTRELVYIYSQLWYKGSQEEAPLILGRVPLSYR